MGSTQNILVPIDFSEQSLIALSQTYNLARFTSTEITLLYVIEEDSSALLFFSKKKEDKELYQKIKGKLDELAADASKKAGVKINTMIVRGKIYEQIVKTAEDISAKFIFMGTNGSMGLKKFIGSNTLRVVKEAPCPVITIKGKSHKAGCDNIVLPLDLSKETKEKVNKAVEFAKYFNSAIRVITVLTMNDEFIVKKLMRQLNQVQEFITSKGVKCTSEAVEGSSVADEVVKFSEKVKADLIMIMTQQETDWTDLFISSQAQQIINHTDVPVLSIRPTEKADTTFFTPY